MTRRVAIIGAAHRFPGTTPETFWQDLKAEKDLVTRVAPDRWSQEAYLHPDKRQPGTSYTFAAGSLGDISGFDAGFFGISPREAAHMDPQQRLLLELAWEAMEHAGTPPASLRGSDCGVFVGVASLDYSYRMADDMAAIDTTTATGTTSSIASNRISYLFDLHGPSLSLDTACSSSMVAFHQACQAIRAGETDTALAGGISLHLHPYGFLIFAKASMLSPNGRCRVFDEAGDGYVRSEGGGLFLLKDYDTAVADGDRILAVVAGSRVNTDGHKTGLTVPNPAAQASLMRRAYDQAGIDPDQLDYLEAHGTGTAVGDPIEARAIGEALGQRRRSPLPIGSIKSNLGHLETASGVAGLAKALYSLQHREVPATIGIERPNPRIEFDAWNLRVVTAAQPLKPEGRLVIGVNSFGFGGANAHVILESPPEAPAAAAVSGDHAPGPVPLRFSARGEAALKAMAGELAGHLRASDDALYDIAHTLYHRRERHADGALLLADSKAQAAELLEAFAGDDEAPAAIARGRRLASPSGPAFVYAGNGCQWETMGKELLEGSATFAAAVDEVDALFEPLGGFSLRAELAGENGRERFARTEIAQPALFALQVGLTALLREHGIEPAAVTGHSVGEVAAAWACGALTLSDAVTVIHYRSHYQGQTRGQGEMTAVALGAAEIQALLERPDFQGISLAGINSARGVTLAGDADKLAALERHLAERDVFAKRLPLDYAFHSPAMDPIRAGVVERLADLSPRPTALPFVSTVAGDRLDGTDLGADYWWLNIRQPVLFEAVVETLLDDGMNVFIEIGAHPVLRRYLNEGLQTREAEGRVLSTLERQTPAGHCMTQAIGQALLHGHGPEGRHWFPVEGRRVELPRYPWQRERHWRQPTGDAVGVLDRPYRHPLLGYPLAQQALTWEGQLDTQRLPWLADHRVGDGVVFPGAGFAELALAAADAWKAPSPIDIEALEIHSPLLLDAPQGKRLRLGIRDADGRLRIHSRPPASDEPWALNATARVMAETRGLLLSRRAPALPQRAPDFDRDQHLALARRIGLHYGPAFQAIAHGWVEGDEILGVVEPTEAILASGQDLLLHPGILDSAFQLFIPRLAEEFRGHGDLAFVPVRLERLQFRHDAEAPALIRVRLTSRAPHSLCADVELFDARGEAIAVVQAARFKAVSLTRDQRHEVSYLDHRLVPAPRRAGTLALDAATTRQAADELQQAYRTATGARYADEVEPLLDALVAAFLREAFAPLADDDGRLPPAPPGQGLEAGLRALARDAGLLYETTDGAWLEAADDDVDAATVWNLLIRDYPAYAALPQQVGRIGRHLPALLAESRETASLALAPDLTARLIHQAIGELGWQTLATTLGDQLEALLGTLPAGHRLGIVEASATAPPLAARLLARLASDRHDYRFLGLNDAALTAAEALGERHPGLTVLSPQDVPPAGPGASLALLTLDGPLDATREALECLPAHLAPGACVALVGVPDAPWQRLIALALGEETPPCCPISRVPDLLASLGYEVIETRALEGDDGGAHLLLARAPEAVAPQPETQRDAWLVVAGPAEQALGEAIATGLDTRDQDVRLCLDDEAAPATLLTGQPPTQVIDLRGLGTAAQARRCTLATQWLQALDASSLDTTGLWLLTRDVARGIAGGAVDHDADGGARPIEDAALWGFGRSLQNEAGQRPVRLLDLPPAVEPDSPVLEALVVELCQPDAETELAIDADGQRWAPRLTEMPAPERRDERLADDQALSLGFELPGQLRHLRWQPRTLAPLSDDQVEVEVKATGLNFRDVMYALGLLSDEAIEHGFAGPTLGLEFAGRVTRVGQGVTRFAPGDDVVGFGPASFSDRLVADTHSLAPLPAGIDHAAAATIPTTFFTVYYALKHLARLAPGERLLIHGAAGGVGLAAIQIGRWLGAELYATVGSEEKRDFMALLGVERLYDSRSLTFAEEILHDSDDGRGVDVVLNSLAGEAINQNLRVLNPFGRFLELGKRDFYENTEIGLRPFRNNLSYFGIDSDQLMREKPALTQTLFGEMMALFDDGTLSPLSYTAFGSDRVVEAFRFMQQARQIGKVVVTYDQPPVAEPPAATPEELRLGDDASYLVTGGLGGFGLATAEWLAERGARHLILLGRRGAETDEAREGIARLEAQGVEVHAAACDVTDRAALAALLDGCRATLPPLKGVVHAATVIDDGLIRNLDGERIARALAPKVEGARHLDTLTRDAKLDFFVLYSSATTLFGNPGQASYIAANHWLEGLAASRRAQGLAATCVRWGAIEDVGFLARHTQTRDALQERLGGQALASREALRVLEQMLLHDSDALGVLELDWHALARFLPTAEAPRYREIARAAGEANHGDGDDDLQRRLVGLAPEELHELLLEVLRKELAKILLVEEAKIDCHRSVYEMGFDSLMGVELMTALESRLGVQVSVMVLSEASTLDKLAGYLQDKLKGDTEEAPEDDQARLASLAARHGATNELQTSPTPQEAEA